MTQINAFNPVGSGGAAAAASGFSQMTSEDFIQVIFTELANQDPFQPNDSAALLEQLGSIRSIESDMQLSTKLESLVFENQLSAATSMIGKFVGGLTPEGMRVGGNVLSVVRQGGEVAVELDSGWFLPLDGVETIIDPSLVEGLDELDDVDGGEEDADGDADGEDTEGEDGEGEDGEEDGGEEGSG
jgi:hypothetical protein